MADVVRMPERNQFTRADLDHILESTFVEGVEFHQAIDSTNNRALELAHEPSVRAPLLVLAETQTEGRGRGANHWWADQGALTFSLLLQTDARRLPPRLWPQASLMVGLAVCEAIEDFLDEPPGRTAVQDQKPTVQLKWPNDVYVQRRKVCGILIELPPERKEAIVIGIGINVNNSAWHAPGELQSSAIALCDAASREFSLSEVLVRVLVRLQDRLGWIGRRDDELRTRWRERCLLTGHTVQVDWGRRRVVGRCHGIDDEGALVIQTANQTERCFAGTVTRF
jgi:BirA family biotin operon repressor/biotin-[acetyl-CoA-carboxylase] ligase